MRPFVYTTKITFMIKVTREKPPKMKNIADPPKLSLTIGRMIMHNEPPNQFSIVAKGTTFAGIISGTYIQTVGPIVVLKNIMYSIKTAKTIQNPALNLSMKIKRIPIIMSHIPRAKLPVNKRVFLANARRV